MTNIGGAELVVVLVLLAVLSVVPFVVAYWVIRLAVRHGVMDAQHRSATRILG